MKKINNDIIIVGSGPAGYTSAIYCARGGYKPLIITGSQQGGQLTTTTMVDNWSGAYDGIDGPELMMNMQKHAEKFGTESISDEITSVDFSDLGNLKLFGQNEYTAKAVIIATGASHKHLNLASEEKFSGKGVHYCATCDGFFYRGKDIAVIGGGNTAVAEAIYLAKFCKKVYLIVRGTELKCEKVYLSQVNSIENIEILFSTFTEDFLGGDFLSSMKINVAGESRELSVEGAFIAIGLKPNSTPFAGALNIDDYGYIKLAGDPEFTTQTSIKGVFVAGDVEDNIYRQAIVSAGSGCKTAVDAMKFLERGK